MSSYRIRRNRLLEQNVVRRWYEALAAAEKVDARHGLVLPGDSALAVVLNSMDEAAHAGDPEFDSRVGGGGQ